MTATAAVTKAAPVWGEHVAHDHLSRKNITNAILCAAVLAPSFAVSHYLFTACDVTKPIGDACKLAIESPIAFPNVLFFANVTVGFWLIGLIQRSFWLIDPYWTILPPLLGHLYRLHPRAAYNQDRSIVMLGLLWLWALRLARPPG